MKVVLATPEEKAAWKRAKGLYPLHGWVTINDPTVGKVKLALEDLRGSWRLPEPVWELHTPHGYHDAATGQHTHLEYNIKGVLETAKLIRLEKCNADCGSGFVEGGEKELVNGVAAS